MVRSRRGVLLTELKLKDLHLVPVDLDQEKVAFMFRQYGLVSAPVTDPNGRMLGVITVVALAFAAGELAGLYGPVGQGGALILVLSAALLFAYFVALPGLWLGALVSSADET